MNSKKINLIGKIIFALLFIFLISRNIYNHYSLRSSHRFTIGIVEAIEINSKGGFSVHFSYNVFLKELNGSTIVYQFDKSLVGSKFYVRFSTSNHKNCEILLEKRVPTHIKEAPPEGWKKIPN